MRNTTSSGDLTYAQLESVWLNAAQGTKYDTSTWAALMAAIAEAESSGNPNSLNPTDNNGKQSSYGLWQISTGTHTAPAANWNDPTENAKLAISKLNSQGLGAWGTYTSGAYKRFLSGGTTPDNSWQNLGPGGLAGLGGEGIAGENGSSTSDTCLLNIDLSITSFCLMSKTNARALIGGALVVGSLVLFTASAIVLVSAGFRKAAPAVGAIAKGPVGMIAGAAMSAGKQPNTPAKTTKSVSKPIAAEKPAPAPQDTTPSGGTGSRRGSSGEPKDKQQGTGKHRGKAAPLPAKKTAVKKPAPKPPEDAIPGKGKRRKE